MGFFGWIIILVLISIVCRFLRAMFEVVDYIAYIMLLVVFVGTWIGNGFWAALLAGFIGLIVITFVFGIGGGTEVRRFGHKYTLNCGHCNYGDLEIQEDTEDGVWVRCRRCGRTSHHKLNH